MPTGHIRTGLVAAFAVMFGIVQLLCACMDMPTSQTASHQSSNAHEMNMVMTSHDHQAMREAERVPVSHDHGEHNHQAECSHCDDIVVLAVNADVAPSVYTTPTHFKTAFLTRNFVTRADIAATNLSALRWLDPPRRLTSSDPVTLYTRSLI